MKLKLNKNISFILLSILLVCAAVPVTAADNVAAEKQAVQNKAPVKEPVEDFSRGFAQLHKIGVPVIDKKARIGRISIDFNDMSVLNRSFLCFSLSGKSAKVQKYIIDTDIYTFSEEQEESAKERLKQICSKLGGKPDEFNQALLEWYDKYNRILCLDCYMYQDEKPEQILAGLISTLENSERTFDSGRSILSGHIMIYATYLYDCGDKENANKIASMLFRKYGKRQVLGSCLDVIATSALRKVYIDFVRSGDLACFGADIDKLLQKYKNHWIIRPGVVILRDKIKAQLTEKPQPLKGDNLGPEDLKIAEDMLNSKQLLFNIDFCSWIMSDDEKTLDSERVSTATVIEKGDVSTALAYAGELAQKRSPFKRVIEGKADSLPLLVVLCGDETLTCIPRATNDRWDIFEEKNDVSGTPEQIYEVLQFKPKSRGEIARLFLTSLTEETSMSPLSLSEEINQARSIGMTFYEKLKNKNELEICRTLVWDIKANISLVKEAIRYLIHHGSESDFQKLEERMLSGDSLSKDIVTLYISKRGTRATAFKDKVIEFMKKQYVLEESEMKSYSSPEQIKRFKKEFEQKIKSLNELISDITPEQIIAEVITGKRKNDYLTRSLFKAKAGSYSKDKRLGIILDAIIASDRPDAIVKFFRPPWNLTPFISDNQQNREKWLKLLDDKRRIDSSTLVKNIVALIICQEDCYSENKIVGAGVPVRRLYETADKRARKIIDGKQIKVSRPDSEAVSGKRIKEIVAQLLSVTPDKAGNAVRNLSDEEFLAVMNLADPELNAHLVKQANHVAGVNIELKDVPPLNISDDMSSEVVQQLFKYMRELTEAGKTGAIEVCRDQELGGITINVISVEKALDIEARKLNAALMDVFFKTEDNNSLNNNGLMVVGTLYPYYGMDYAWSPSYKQTVPENKDKNISDIDKFMAATVAEAVKRMEVLAKEKERRFLAEFEKVLRQDNVLKPLYLSLKTKDRYFNVVEKKKNLQNQPFSDM